MNNLALFALLLGQNPRLQQQLSPILQFYRENRDLLRALLCDTADETKNKEVSKETSQSKNSVLENYLS